MVDYQTGGHSVYDLKYHIIWVRDEFSQLKKRYWGQHLWARGYFCATVGTVNEDTVRRYIEGQQVEGDDVFDIKD